MQREKAAADELHNAKRQLTASVEQQSATKEILRLICRLDRLVLDAVARSAARQYARNNPDFFNSTVVEQSVAMSLD